MIFAHPQPTLMFRSPYHSMPRCLVVLHDPSAARGETQSKAESTTATVDEKGATQEQPKQQLLSGNKVVYQARGVVVTQAETGALTFTIDLPGVRLEDVVVECNPSGLTINAERKVNGQTTSKFSQEYALNSVLIDVDGIKATMEDGVLSVVVPTKEATKAYDVPLSATYPPEQDAEQGKKTFQFTVDLPGVKASDLKVGYEDNKVLIKGERKRSSGSYKIDKYVPIDTKRIDASNLESFLADGVLTVRAPLLQEVAAKKIALVGAQTTDSVVETTKANKDEEFEIVVENADDEETVKA